MTDWIQAGCAIVGAVCAIFGVCIGIRGIAKTLPNITKQVEKISDKMFKKRFDFCDNCSYMQTCASPHLDDTGFFDKKNEIDNHEISNGIIELYEEIKQFQFTNTTNHFGSKEHQGCLLHKLTLAINLIGSTNLEFNMHRKDITGN